MLPSLDLLLPHHSGMEPSLCGGIQALRVGRSHAGGLRARSGHAETTHQRPGACPVHRREGPFLFRDGPGLLPHVSQRGQSPRGIAQPQTSKDSAAQDRGCYLPSHLSSVTFGETGCQPSCPTCSKHFPCTRHRRPASHMRRSGSFTGAHRITTSSLQRQSRAPAHGLDW